MKEKKKYKRVLITLSPLAERKFFEIPAGKRSHRISKFLERCDPKKEDPEIGKRE